MSSATAYIDINAIKHNLNVIENKAPNSLAWITIKANAYGHGLVPVALAIAPNANGFCVARIKEAIKLRANGITQPLLLLEGFSSASELPLLQEYNLQTTIHCIEQLKILENVELSHPLTAWLKIDTGMNRLGVRPEHVNHFITRLNVNKNIAKPLNFFSHFSCADELDKSVTQEQIILFSKLTDGLGGERSIAATSGTLFWPNSHYDWVRSGIGLYGISPVDGYTGIDLGLRSVMKLTSGLLAIRDIKKGEPVGYGATWHANRATKIGVVAIGYGDGYLRSAPHGTPVLVNGRRVPLVGRVSMDMLTIDLGPDTIDKVGDEVVLWGEDLPVEEVAHYIGSISYELVTNVSSRVNFIYI